MSFIVGGIYYLVELFTGFPGGTCGKEPGCQCRRHKRCQFDPCVEDPLEEGKAWRILAWRNSMDRGAWWATVHRVAKSQT